MTARYGALVHDRDSSDPLVGDQRHDVRVSPSLNQIRCPNRDSAMRAAKLLADEKNSVLVSHPGTSFQRTVFCFVDSFLSVSFT